MSLESDGRAPLSLEVDSDDVAWLVFDDPDRRVNVLTREVMERLRDLLEEAAEGGRAGRIRALVVRSGKPGTFIAGADIDAIADVVDPEEGTAASREAQQLFRRLELLPFLSIAAIDGACMGGGTELALACSYRIASDRPETRIGLPEVRLGILPGFGGTVRLPRLIGLQAALDLLLTGKTLNARRAQRIGLVDESVPPAILLDRARQLATGEIVGARERSRTKRGLMARLLEDTAPGRRVVLQQARKRVMKQTRGHYPAPLEILEVVRRTISVPLESAFDVEAEALGRLVVTEVSKNLIHVFHLMENAKKAAPDADAMEVQRLGVLGAGVMGGGIAQLAASKGLGVRLKDIREEAITQGLQTARELFDKAVQRKRMPRREAERAMSAISPTLDYAGFGAVDLVIEAVVERMDVKKQVLREVEERARPETVLTSNTSALSITEMQNALEQPESVCGLHFFNPVHRMPLVELVRGERTSDETLATAFGLVRRLGKTPLIVQDGPGFLVNRVLAPYMNEAGWLLADGVGIGQIDGALEEFGMPMGPLRLLDEVGLDVAGHVARIMHEAFGERMRPAPPLEALQSTRRLGRKAGAGFYRYEGGKQKEIDDAIYGELGIDAPKRREIPASAIQDRCILAMVNEAARALEDGIVDEAGAVDLGMITGTGFPPFRGGLLRYADSIGLPAVLTKLELFQRELGPRFAPAPLLRERAAAGQEFYD